MTTRMYWLQLQETDRVYKLFSGYCLSQIDKDSSIPKIGREIRTQYNRNLDINTKNTTFLQYDVKPYTSPTNAEKSYR